MATVTDELRQMLTEAGVEWREGSPNKTKWYHGGIEYVATNAWPRNDATRTKLVIHAILTPAQAIAATVGREITGETSDGFHTFNELYHHRAVLFSVIVRDHPEIAWKSKVHHDGTMFDGMFIVGIETPEGQATYHYDIDPYWEMFDCKELERAPEWDGHTPEEAIERIVTLGAGTCFNDAPEPYYFACSSCGTCLNWNPNFCPYCGRKVVYE